MTRNDKFNQKQLEYQQMSLIDLARTDWFERFRDDILILHNPHFHANWEPYKLTQLIVILCSEGDGYGSVNLRPVHLQKNSLLVAIPGEIVASHSISKDFKVTFIVMSERFLSRMNIGDAYLFSKRVESTPLSQLDDRAAALFHSMVTLLHNLMQAQEEAFGLLIKLFYLLVGWIIEPSAEDETQQRQQKAMMEFLKLVKIHYREHRDVAFYADKMNISAKYMTTLIKSASGKSAMQWIEDSVILDAKAQLSSTVNTIQQIAFDLNFQSQSIFGRYFKRLVGMSPSDYRDSVRACQIAYPMH